MPFQSEKQRRYLHANHPEIAKRWERDYGDGGMAQLNAQLNQLPEYYLPAAKGGIANHFKKRVKLQDSIESLSDTEFQTMYPDWDPNQFTREEYLQLLSENEGNGVLDLSTNEEAIEVASTEENEIIPDLLAPGSAAGILRLKDGGNIRLQPHTATDLLAKKNPDGTRSKYQPPGGGATSLGSGRDVGGGGPPGGGDPRMTYTAPTVRHHAVDTPTQIKEQKEIDSPQNLRKRAENLRAATVIKVLKRKDLTKDEKWSQVKYQWDQLKKGRKTLSNIKNAAAINPVLGLLAAWFEGSKLKKEQKAEIDKLEKQIGLLEDWDLDARHHAVETPLAVLEQRILDLTQPSTRDDTGGPDGQPLTIDVLAETQEEVEEAPNLISMMDKIRAGQAKRAMLVDKGIIQENPIVDESVTDITMTANKGGLANLFRVKKQ